MNTKKRAMIWAGMVVSAGVLAGPSAATAGFSDRVEADRIPEPKREAPERKPSAPSVPKPVNGVIEGVSISTLDAIADCESGGDPTAVNAAGYYGKYQFDLETWAAVGGSGNPARASEAEQDYRAALLYGQSGPSPWPVCGV